jgi:hypothetical protein
MVEKSEDYTDNLGRCIIRKSASITNILITRFAVPVLILVIGVVLFTILIILANRLTEIYQNAWGSLWATLNTVSPLVYLILLVVLPIPLYSTFWCIRHRRRLRELNVREETPICPIDGFSQREKGV